MNHFLVVFFVSFALFASFSSGQSEPSRSATVYLENGSFSLSFGREDVNGVAWGNFEESINATGWGRLFVTTNGNYPDDVQGYAAGFLEGALTPQLIYYYHLNTKDYLLFEEEQPGIDKWLTENDAWARSQIAMNSNTSQYWQQIAVVYSQMDGMFDAYGKFRNQNTTEALNYVQFLRFQANCDLDDINDSLLPSERQVDWFSLSKSEFRKRFYKSTHCSALIKVTPDLSELFAGHVTWYYYSTMLRVFKTYTLNLNNPSTGATTVSFSSAPGTLSSGDDYYQMSSGLVSIETSLVVMNMSLYEYVVPESLLYWVRVIAANRMAESGKEWSEVFVEHNSGTYNNQWMIVDYNKFTPGSPLKNDTLWIVEQMPKYCQSGDQTGVLQFGYWPSYNVPFYPFIYEVSGNREGASVDPISSDFQMCARAEIFRRDETSVTDLTTFQRMLRYNNWQNDPLSLNDPGNAISSRFDLEPLDPDFYGAIDGKSTSYSLNKMGTTQAVCGPTHDEQPIFSWPENPEMPHWGQPMEFGFGWVDMAM